MAVEYDTIRVSHTLQFCKPAPTNTWDPGDDPARTECGNYSRDLKDFPYNDEPSGGSSHRISPSEMALCFLRLDNYPGSGGIEFLWYRQSDTKPFYKYRQDVPAKSDPSWSWWYWWSYSYVGYFKGEIVTAEPYFVAISTTWGDAKIRFDVADTRDATLIGKIVKDYIDPLRGEIGDIRLALSRLDRVIMDALSKVEQEAAERKKDIAGIWAKLEGWLVERLVALMLRALDREVAEAKK